MSQIDAAFAALSDPTRRAILTRLSQGEQPVAELASGFDMSGPAISHHLKVLEKAGLIARRVAGTQRPCRLAPEGLSALEEWLGTLHRALDANYTRLDALLADMTQGEIDHDSHET